MKSLLKNYLYTATYQFLLLILPIITLPYVSRVLMPEGVGLNAWVYSVNSYFVMFAVLGLTVYAQREIAAKRENLIELPRVFWKIEFASIFMGLISLLLYIFFIVFYGKYTIYLLAYSLSIIAVIFDVSWLFSGMEKFKILAFRNILVKIVAVFCIFVFVRSTKDLLIYIFIQSGSILISNLSLWPAALQIVGWPTKIKLTEISHQIVGSFQLFIPQVAVSLYLTLNKILLGAFSSTEQVGFFDSSDKIVRMIFSLFVAVSTVVMPRVANMFAKHQVADINNLLKVVMVATMFVLFPIMFILYLFAPLFINLLFGSQYQDMIGILRVMTLMLPALAVANVMGNQVLVPMKMIKAYTLSIVYGAIINLVVEIPLIIILSASGAAIAVVLAEAVVMCFQIFYSKNILDMRYIFKPTVTVLLTGTILVISAYCLSLISLSTQNSMLLSTVLMSIYILLNYKKVKHIILQKQ